MLFSIVLILPHHCSAAISMSSPQRLQCHVSIAATESSPADAERFTKLRMKGFDLDELHQCDTPANGGLQRLTVVGMPPTKTRSAYKVLETMYMWSTWKW
jgi:hypothetical protein